MKIENVEVYGFGASLRGMRNPKDSWDKSDSGFIDYCDGQYIHSKLGCMDLSYNPYNFNYEDNIEGFMLGNEDKKLAQDLTRAGSEHCKFLRQIHVWFDLTLPRYIWSEYDTYSFNNKNSCSTMHTVHKRLLTQDDFEYHILQATLDDLNYLITRRKNLEITAHEFIHTLKNRLPDGFLQKRTVDTSYAELYNQDRQRHNHRLDQWKEYIKVIRKLPYYKQLTGVE